MRKQHFYSARKFFANRPKCIFLLFIILAGVFIYRIIWMRININWTGLNINDEITQQPALPVMPKSLLKSAIFSKTSGPVASPTINMNKSRKFEEIMANLLDCQRVFNGDWKYAFTNKFTMRTDPSESEMPMDCESIRRRNGLPGEWTNTTQEEIDFPLAFARIVNQDYLMIEMELATNYAPQNWYCFSVDVKAKPLFHSRMHQLASCFPNVFLTQREFSITSTGFNLSDAKVECAKELAQPGRQWKYLVTLQNHDIQAKTNAEMVRIFQWLDGANDIEVVDPFDQTTKGARERIVFYLANFDWTFKALKLFKNDTRNHGIDSAGNPLKLHLSKGYSMASLSRPFIDFIVHELSLDLMLAQLNQGSYAMDELLWQTLSTTDVLNAPGGFPHQCYDQGMKTPFITRYSLWERDTKDSSNKISCRSGDWRHSICIFGLEDLVEPALRKLPHLFVNKMMPEYDFAAIKCWHHWMRQKRLNHSELKLDPKPYTNWPQTKYNQQKDRTKEINCILYYT